MAKRTLATLLAVLIMLTALPLAFASAEATDPNFNPTGLPIVKEKVTLRILTGNSAANPADFNDLQIIKDIEAATNVHIEWIMAGAGFEEKKSLMLATGDLPDIINRSVTAAELVKYGANGTFIPMQDLIDNYAPNTLKLFDETSGLRQFLTAPDGNIYGVPRMNSAPWTAANGLGIINKTWLDKLGLAMPTTIEEFYNVLLAFKNGDPNGNGVADEIPMAFAKFNNAGATTLSDVNGISYLMAAFGVPMGLEYMDVKDGKVVSAATTGEYKEAVKYISKMYAEGLIDPESFTMSREQLNAKISQDPFTVGYIQGWDIGDEFSNPAAKENYAFMPLLKGLEGNDPVFYEVPLYGVSRGAGVITSACQYPEVAMRWIDYILDTYTSMQICEGPIGVRIADKGDGTYEVKPAPEGKNATQWKDENALGGSGFFAITSNTFANILRFPATDAKVAFLNESALPYADKEAFPPVYYTVEEADEVALLKTDILSYIERKGSEWIMNGGVDEQWDAYLAELNAMGLTRLMEINQAAYDRFIK